MLSDFIDGYPVNWMSAYISVEINSNNMGREMSLFSKNDMLSNEQKNMLADLSVGAKVVVKVKYNTKKI